MLRAWASLWAEYKKLHQLIVQLVGRDELCRRFCRIPGVGAVTVLSVKAAIVTHAGSPNREPLARILVYEFRAGSRPGFHRYPRTNFKCGDGEVRTVLYEAASAMLVRSKQWCSVKAWGMRIAAKRGHKRAVVAMARKLAVIMHRMWLDGSEFLALALRKMITGIVGWDANTDGARRRSSRLWRAPSRQRLNGRELVELPLMRRRDIWWIEADAGEHDILPAPTSPGE